MSLLRKSITLKLTLLLLLSVVIIFGVSGIWIFSSTNTELTEGI